MTLNGRRYRLTEIAEIKALEAFFVERVERLSPGARLGFGLAEMFAQIARPREFREEIGKGELKWGC
jgi:hypothetical protein